MVAYNPPGNGWFPLPIGKAEGACMPTDNSRRVFFPSMLAKYSTVGFVWRMLRRRPYSLPFPVLADGSTSSALLVVCKCRAFGQCVCLAVSMLFFAPVFTLIPGFGRPGLSRPAASSPFQIPYKKPLAASGVHPRPRARRFPQTERRRFNLRRDKARGSPGFRSLLPQNGNGSLWRRRKRRWWRSAGRA